MANEYIKLTLVISRPTKCEIKCRSLITDFTMQTAKLPAETATLQCLNDLRHLETSPINLHILLHYYNLWRLGDKLCFGA